MRSPAPTFLPRLFIAGLLFGARLCAQDRPETDAPPSPEPWQIAGIRAAFGDSRRPMIEPSLAVQNEALKICAKEGWGVALDPQEVGAYLASPDASVRLAAITALGQMGPDAERFAKELAALLRVKNQNTDVLGAVAGALSQMGPLSRIGPDGTAMGTDIVPLIPALLQNPNPEVRASAGLALRRMGKEGAVFAKQVAGLLKSGSAIPGDVSGYFVAEALGDLRQDGAAFAPEIAALLKDGNPEVRGIAAFALGPMGKAGAFLAKDLAAALNDPEPEVRRSTLAALREMGPDGVAFAGDAAVLLKDPDPGVRQTAADTLRRMGKRGPAFGDESTAFLIDEKGGVRPAAIKELGKVGNEKPPDDVTAFSTDADDGWHGAVIESLVEMSKNGASKAGDLVALLTDADRAVRDEAARMLGGMGKAGIPVAEDVVPFLENQGGGTRAAAAFALGRMGLQGEPFAKEIAPLLKDGNYNIRFAAAQALGTMGKEGAVFAKDVAVLLEDRDAKVRKAAATTLGEMGQTAACFAGEVSALLKDPSQETREPAVIALGSLGKEGAAFAKEIGGSLKDQPQECGNYPRITALDVLRQMNSTWAFVAKGIAPLLAGEDAFARQHIASLLDDRGNPGGDLELQAVMLSAAHAIPAGEVPRLRAHLRLWAGGNAALQRTVTWLGKPGMDPMPPDGLPPAETRETLAIFSKLWEHTAFSPPLRAELAGRIGEIAQAITRPLDAEMVKTLDALATELKGAPDYVAAYDAVVSASHRH